jgi:hypothetical protein
MYDRPDKVILVFWPKAHPSEVVYELWLPHGWNNLQGARLPHGWKAFSSVIFYEVSYFLNHAQYHVNQLKVDSTLRV